MTYEPIVLDGHEFRDIAALEPDIQRQLLADDDPRLRVWAAWALGLRLVDDASSLVRDAIATEPVAGVRRHLLVMLAGFGEVDIVAAIARHDPDADVRKTAARFVGELAVKHVDAYAIAAQLLDDERAGTRAALIDGLGPHVPDFIESRLAEARSDEATAVREAMARRDAAMSDLATLQRTATSDPNSVVRRGALRALVGQIGVGEALARMSSPQRMPAIADLKALRITASFAEVEALQPGPTFLDILRPEEMGSTGRTWLLGFVARPVRDYWRTVAAAYDVVDFIADAEERTALASFLDSVEDSLRSGGERDASEEGALTEWGNWSPWEAQRRELLEQLREKLG